jgi:NAD(P)H-dependent FMN reductase
MDTPQVQVLLLLGCHSSLSSTRSLLHELKSLLRDRGAKSHIWDLYYDPLPIFDFTFDSDVQRHKFEVVQTLARLANDADAFVWGTPSCHNSFSGVLKNALDHLDVDQFRQKPVAFISHDRERSVQVSSQLRVVAEGLSAKPVPTQIVTANEDFELYKGDYIVVNTRIEKLLIHMADELIEYSKSMRRSRMSTNE